MMLKPIEGSQMVDHTENRDAIVRELQRELVGPAPMGKELDCSGKIVFHEAAESYGPWRQKGSGEEIITRDSPTKRYGVGVLYPIGVQQEYEMAATMPEVSGSEQEPQSETQEPLTEPARESLEVIAERTGSSALDSESDDFDLSTANTFRPNSMAVSFLSEVPAGSELVVEASGGRYKRITIDVEGKERVWWLRSPVTLKATFRAEKIGRASC